MLRSRFACFLIQRDDKCVDQELDDETPPIGTGAGKPLVEVPRIEGVKR